jgi:signal transduction histidine kinase
MSRPRVGRFALFAVLVPTALAAGAGWLWFAGPLAGARRAEAAAAHAALDAAEGAFRAALLEVDVTSLAFPPSPPLALGGTDLAEQQGLALAARGDLAAALPFLRLAQANGAHLSARGSLALGRALLAGGDVAAARPALARARAGAGALGGVPVAVLARLVEVRAAADGGDLDAARSLRADFADGTEPLPAAAVSAVLDELRAIDPDTDGDRATRRLASASRAWLDLRGVPPMSDRPGPDGSALLVRDGEVVVADAPAMQAAVARAFAAAAAAFPQIELGADTLDDPLARRAVPALGAMWSASSCGVPASAWIERACLALLALAAAAFVLGQLALSRLVRREVRLARLRSDFVDAVSHELRTPLSAMSLRAEMLARGEVPSARLPHYLHVLHLDVRRLAEHVQRVLDFARLDKGEQLERRPTSLRSVLADGVRLGLPALRLVGQRLALDVARDLPELDVDRSVLARAVRNLLENAARHAPPGSRVELAAELAGDTVVVDVRDRGPGVPRAERRTIFAPFQRGERAGSTDGSGLGLSLVDRAVRLHGGRVDVLDRDGGGAVFRLSLPLRGRRRLVS